MKMVKAIASFAAVMLLLAGCAQLETVAEAEKTPEATGTPIATSSPSSTPLATQRPALQRTPQPSGTSTPSPSPTPAVSLETIEIEETGVTELSPNVHYLVDSDANGQKETLTLYDMDALGGFGVKLEVQYGQKKKSFYERSYFISAFYINNGNGNACVLLSLDEASDDWYTNVYRLDGGATPGKTDHISGYVWKVDGAMVKAKDFIYVLGTYMSDCEFTLGDDMTLTPAGDGLWHVQEDCTRDIIAKAEIPVEWLEDGSYVPGTLAPGTSICISASDLETVVYFARKDGKEGRLYYAAEDGSINGMDEYDCFEELPYEG